MSALSPPLRSILRLSGQHTLAMSSTMLLRQSRPVTFAGVRSARGFSCFANSPLTAFASVVWRLPSRTVPPLPTVRLLSTGRNHTEHPHHENHLQTKTAHPPSSHNEEADESRLSATQRLKIAMNKYGKTAIGVYLALGTVTLSASYIAGLFDVLCLLKALLSHDTLAMH